MYLYLYLYLYLRTTSKQGIEGQDDARALLIIGQMEPMNHGGNLTMIEMPAR